MGSCKSASKVKDNIEADKNASEVRPRIRHLNIEFETQKVKLGDIKPGLFVIREAYSWHEDSSMDSLI